MISLETNNLSIGLNAPSDAFPSPPVVTKAQLLPFGQLSWENFERLCYRLVKASGSIEHCARYGLQGEAQEGIDIFARADDGKYDCWQAKRHKTFGATKLKDAVALFEGGSWAGKSRKFVIAVQASLGATSAQREIERLAARLKEKGIEFRALDEDGLTEILRQHPKIIDDFFGRAWVSAIAGPIVAKGLERLDGVEFARVRQQLATVYAANFHFLDPGSFGSMGEGAPRLPLTLLERFISPDLIVRDRQSDQAESGYTASDVSMRHEASSEFSSVATRGNQQQAGSRSQPQTRRSKIGEWMGSGDRLAVIGEAGLGKSTLLRAIALDLLQQQQVFPTLAERWGAHLPLHISFAAWAREVGTTNAPVSLKDMVGCSLQKHLTANIEGLIDRAIDEKRVLLLVDGLDEWSDEQAARTALATLVTFVEAHGIPTIVTGRPRGMARIGTLPATWKRAAIAPLLREQQAALAARWFDRYAPPEAHSMSPNSAVPDRAQIFLGELARDFSLAVLAETPLLLIGLITLSLRGKILPRNRIEAFEQLVALLLEEHPTMRATAAGDTRSRFRHADDALLRRAAIARLAFSIREQAGGAGFALDRARALLVEFLASSDGFDLERFKARAAADEILAVNAETQGILVEKAPGEIGFAHASFEEYLGAEYLHGKPFDEVLKFVEAQAGEPRWRNVIANLLGIVTRRDEFDRLVAAIELPSVDLLARAYRQGLLSEVAFGSSGRFPATGKRLVERSLSLIEFEDWMPLRKDALRAALGAVGDPTFGAFVEVRLACWTPPHEEYRAKLIEALAEREHRPDVAEIIWQSLHDDDGGTQRAAAVAYAEWHKGDAQAGERLKRSLTQTARPHVAAAYLETLMYGWPDDEQLEGLFSEASRSFDPTLRLVGIVGLVKYGKVSEGFRDELLWLQSHWSGVDHAYQRLAGWCLIKAWADDDALIADAISRMRPGGSQSIWEYDAGKSFLLNCSTEKIAIQEWLLRELSERSRVSTMGLENVWSGIARFSLVNAQLREASVETWMRDDAKFELRELQNFVAIVPDDRLKTIAIDFLNDEEDFRKHWACRALIAGWGVDDPEVQQTFEQIRQWPVRRLINLSALLPDIEPDAPRCRAKLLEIACLPEARRDLIAIGLERCGCDGEDEEAVAAILDSDAIGYGGQPYDILFRNFGASQRVRALATSLVDSAAAPLSSLAELIDQVPEIRRAVLRATISLPLELRSDIVDAAMTGGVGTALGVTLGQYDRETDSELKARMSIGHHKILSQTGRGSTALPRLATEIVAYGAAMDGTRAAALVGFTIIRELEFVATMRERDKPVNLTVGGYVFPVPTVTRLICEHWSEFRSAFGDELEGRFRSLGNEKITAILGEGATLSDAARSEFLKGAEDGTMDLALPSLRSLAALRPGSELLRDRCLEAFAKRGYDNGRVNFDAEVAQILAESLPQDETVLNALLAEAERWHSASSVLALGVYSPGHQALERYKDDITEMTREFGGWAAASQIISAVADADEFTNFIHALVSRRAFFARFDAQKFANRAIETRLRLDADAADRMAREIAVDAHPSVLASFPRFFAGSGRMTETLRSKLVELLGLQTARQVIPLAGYDAIADGIRSVRLALFDALHFGAEV